MGKVNVGLRIPSVQPEGADAVRDFVLRAEELGFHSIWAGDHVFYHMDVLQPLHLLTWVAALTSRVRLGTSVMLSAYINPVLVAKAAASIDWLSGGRLTLGMSIGGTEAEFASIGVPISQRLGRLLENVAIMRELWAKEDDVSYEGRYYKVEHANVRPKPVQKPGIPIYFGANSEAMMRRAARLADGWACSSGPDVGQFLARVEQVRAWAQEAGRDPDRFGISKQHNISIDSDPERAREQAETHFKRYYGPRFNVASTTFGTLEQCSRELARFAEASAPEVTLALEPPSLDLAHLELIWQACKPLTA